MIDFFNDIKIKPAERRVLLNESEKDKIRNAHRRTDP